MDCSVEELLAFLEVLATFFTWFNAFGYESSAAADWLISDSQPLIVLNL